MRGAAPPVAGKLPRDRPRHRPRSGSVDATSPRLHPGRALLGGVIPRNVKAGAARRTWRAPRPFVKLVKWRTGAEARLVAQAGPRLAPQPQRRPRRRPDLVRLGCAHPPTTPASSPRWSTPTSPTDPPAPAGTTPPRHPSSGPRRDRDTPPPDPLSPFASPGASKRPENGSIRTSEVEARRERSGPQGRASARSGRPNETPSDFFRSKWLAAEVRRSRNRRSSPSRCNHSYTPRPRYSHTRNGTPSPPHFPPTSSPSTPSQLGRSSRNCTSGAPGECHLRSSSGCSSSGRKTTATLGLEPS